MGVADLRPYYTQIIGHNSVNVHRTPTKLGTEIRLILCSHQHASRAQPGTVRKVHPFTRNLFAYIHRSIGITCGHVFDVYLAAAARNGPKRAVVSVSLCGIDTKSEAQS